MEIRYPAIRKLTYEDSRNHRLAGGFVLAGISPLSGIFVMASESESHWLVIDWDSDGVLKTVVLHLDDSYYKEFLDTLEFHTGKHVDSPAIKDR